MNALTISAIAVCLALTTPVRAAEVPTTEVDPGPMTAGDGEADVKPFGVRLGAELGFLAVPFHIIQFSRDGTRFDYVDEGGQDVLFPFLRFDVDLQIERDHHVVLLYQPLSLEAEVTLRRPIRQDGVDFPAGTPIRAGYDFPFWRISYFYDFVDDPLHELSFGASLQIRDATIEFESLDGKLLVANRDVGPVPALKLRGRYGWDVGAWIGFEVDGIYAPISVLNGSDNEVTGAIVDLSLRAGYRVDDGHELFLNLRWLGGGAVGDSEEPPPGDGYQKNWLHFVTLSLGAHFQAF